MSSGVVNLEFVRSEFNLADLLTKGLCKKLARETSREMRLVLFEVDSV